jgi:hypothetical protein
VERRYDKPRLDKLGVVPGCRVAIIGVEEPMFAEEVRERTTDVVTGEPAPDTDLIFLAADTPADLRALSDLRSGLRPAGAIWVVSRKGRTATLRYADILDAAVAAGLVDNKVVSFSETHTALRLVIPRALRPRP